jgi:PST family polysaccharide transporter
MSSAAAQLANGACAIALAFAGFGLWSIVWAQIIGSWVEAILGYIGTRKRYRIAFSSSAVREVFRSGGMFTISKLFNWAAGAIDRLVIGRLLGVVALGYYSRASALLATANQMLGTGMMRVLLSTFSKMQHDPRRMRNAFDRALATSITGSTVISAFVVLFADLIVSILLGDRWAQVVPLVQVLFLAFVSRSGYVVAEAVPLALGLSRASAYRQAAQFGLVISGSIIGARFGVLGAAIGIAIAYWLFYLLCLMLVRRLIGCSARRIARIHVNALLLVAFPVIAALGAQVLTEAGGNGLLRLIPAAVFGLTAVVVFGVAPNSILSQDIGRARAHLFDFGASRLRAKSAAN